MPRVGLISDTHGLLRPERGNNDNGAWAEAVREFDVLPVDDRRKLASSNWNSPAPDNCVKVQNDAPGSRA